MGIRGEDIIFCIVILGRNPAPLRVMPNPPRSWVTLSNEYAGYRGTERDRPSEGVRSAAESRERRDGYRPVPDLLDTIQLDDQVGPGDVENRGSEIEGPSRVVRRARRDAVGIEDIWLRARAATGYLEDLIEPI